MESRLSKPSMNEDLIGTPMTGMGKIAAHIPGRCAAMPAPAMITLMENTAYESVASELEEGSGTVGTALNVKHVAATPVGMKVTCETELIKVDGRALTFSVKAFDEKGLTGEREHERFIVFNEKFQAKADAKLEK